MITQIRRWLGAGSAAVIAVLLGIIGYLKLRLSGARKKAAKRALDESRAVTKELQRRRKAEQDAIAESQVELSQALGEIGKRDYFEDGKW